MGQVILVVEDDADTLRVMTRLLQEDGHRVEPARSCAVARELYSRRVFDLCIIDLGLPDGDGCDLLRELLKKRPTRAIALTGYVMDEDRLRASQAGFASHLAKPVTIEILRAAIAAPRLDVKPGENIAITAT